ncbi:MAG TPA: protein kinase [Gemmatimonadales bacterium]|nr:protein kinase [Gemmatimonadales bacterium]
MPDALAVLNTKLADRYAIEHELGRGGMATVYLARDTRHDRSVAIKVLEPDLAVAFGAERFLREIGIAAQLSHPYIVPLIDSGEAGGLLYYVSPFIPGGSLRERLDQDGRLALKDALRIVEEVGAGLDYAHRHGFVHRDVKPENILFADGHALLADFGIARAGATPGKPAVTEVGLALGTPEYMSPEQASGDQNLGSESDVYSLACVLYEMLTGAPPFDAGSARATMAKQITETPRPLRALRPEAPATVGRAVERALEKDPDARFSSVAEFITALNAPPADDGAAPVSPRSIAVLPFVNASPDPENEYLSDGITDELIDALVKVDGLRVASRTSVFALKGKPEDIRAIGALLGCAVVLEGTVRKAGDRLRITAQLTSTDDGRLLWSQRYDRLLDDVFAIQEEIGRTIVGTLRATWFADLAPPAARRSTTSVKAYSLYLKGRYAWNKRTAEGVTEAITSFEQAIAEDPGYAAAYAGLADSYSLQIDYRNVPVHEGHEHAKAYARKALQLDETLAEAHASLAWSTFIYDWDWDKAAQEFRRAIALDPHYATTRQWHAFLLASRGQLEEAVTEVLIAQQLDPTSISVRRSVGWAHYYARRHDQSRYHLLRAIALNPTAAETYRILALTYAEQGDLVEAERVAREALELPGAGSYTLATLGFVLGRAGKQDAARALLADLERREAAEGYVSPVAFATIYLGLNEWGRALPWMERAYDDRRGWMAYLKVNPILDGVRREPEFEALVRRMRL